MNSTRRAIAATQALLILPAILFMGPLILRQLSPLQHEPAVHGSADRYVVRGKNVDIVGVTHLAAVGGSRHRLPHVSAEVEQIPRTSPECTGMVRRQFTLIRDAVCRCADLDGWSHSRNCRGTHGSELTLHAMHHRLRDIWRKIANIVMESLHLLFDRETAREDLGASAGQ